MRTKRTICFAFFIITNSGLFLLAQQGSLPANSVPSEEIHLESLPLWLRCIGWSVLGFFGAGSIGAWLRAGLPGAEFQGKIPLFVIGVFCFAGYSIYCSWLEEISIVPPVLCILIMLLLGTIAKTSADDHYTGKNEQ